MATQQPLDPHQQELVNAVTAAHRTLALARKMKSVELTRRLAESKIELQRQADEAAFQIRMDLEAEISAHASNQDEAIIAAYNSGVPIRRIAVDGFGNQYDGTVTQLIVKLRADGRIGSRENYQHDSDGDRTTVSFPEEVDVQSIIEGAALVEPTFTLNDEELVVSEGIDGDERFPRITVPAVTLTMDRSDPYFKSIAKNEIATGSKFRDATTVTLYKDFVGNLITHESREPNRYYWEHPVARWVKDHPDAALEGFNAAINAAQ